MEFSVKSFIADDGAEIKYVDEGTGTPLLYIYGMGSSIESQTPFIKEMAKDCRCICFDMRSFGMTETYGETTIHRAAQDAECLLTHTGIEKTAIMGYSMGSAVVFSYLAQFGCGKIEKVIIGDMSPKLINEDGWKLGLYQGWYTREMYEEDLKRIKDDYKRFALILSEQILIKRSPGDVRDFSGTAEEIRARIWAEKPHELITASLFKGLVDIPEYHISANYGYWQTLAGADFRGVLKDITVPVGILHANPGSIYSPGAAEYMCEQIPDAVMMPMMGCSHMAAGEDRPQWLKYVKEFIL